MWMINNIMFVLNYIYFCICKQVILGSVGFYMNFMDKPNLDHDIILMRESAVGKIITPNKSARKSQDVFFSKRFIYSRV